MLPLSHCLPAQVTQACRPPRSAPLLPLAPPLLALVLVLLLLVFLLLA